VRRPQLSARVMRWGVRALVRPVLHPRFPVGFQRRWLELATAPTPLPRDVEVRTGELDGRRCEVLAPPGADGTRSVLYLHGGGFTVGSPATHRALAAHLAVATAATVHLLDYRLAPEHPYPAALDDVVAAWRELLAGGADPARAALAGDSAGGWLTLATALRLRDGGDPLPAVLGLISPWLDLTGGSAPDGVTDPMLQPAWLHSCAARFLAGAEVTDPRFAPHTGDLSGLPPMVVQVGSEEILLPDAVAVARAARAAGVPVDLRRLDGLWHVAHASAGLVAESTAAVGAFGAALAGRLSAASRPGR
jgi:epsilon-lactone hydrolase